MKKAKEASAEEGFYEPVGILSENCLLGLGHLLLLKAGEE